MRNERFTRDLSKIAVLISKIHPRCVLRTRLTGYLLQHKQISVSWCVPLLYIREDQGIRDQQTKTGLRLHPSSPIRSKAKTWRELCPSFASSA